MDSEGHHRLLVSKKLKLDYIPVQINVVRSDNNDLVFIESGIRTPYRIPLTKEFEDKFGWQFGRILKPSVLGFDTYSISNLKAFIE